MLFAHKISVMQCKGNIFKFEVEYPVDLLLVILCLFVYVYILVKV